MLLVLGLSFIVIFRRKTRSSTTTAVAYSSTIEETLSEDMEIEREGSASFLETPRSRHTAKVLQDEEKTLTFHDFRPLFKLPVHVLCCLL